MSIFFWRNNHIVDTFANDIANDLYGAIQPQVALDYFEGAYDKKQLKKIEKVFDREIQHIIKKIHQFRTIHSPGVYGKARLHMKFRERLEELGYQSDIAIKVNETIMIKTP